MKILIIANGPSVNKFQYGDIIDKFDNVIRINNYITDGFEEFVGSKITIWCNGANQNLEKRTDFQGKVIVFIPPEILIRKGQSIHGRIQKRLGLKRENYELISEKEMIHFEKKSGCKRLTTGINSILWAMNNFEEVVIHGFDFFQNGKEHYFDSKIKSWIFNQKWLKKGQKHDNFQEKKYIRSLLQLKKIYQLKDI